MKTPDIKADEKKYKPLIKLDDLVPKEDVKGGRRREKTVFGIKKRPDLN